MEKKNRAVGYGRCSTNETRQDTEVQLKELRGYCDRNGWDYVEISEYGSGYRGDKQPKLDELIERIRLKHFDVLVVYSMDRFSRQKASKVNSLLDCIVEKYGCRFIALQDRVDSENEDSWGLFRYWWVYFANKYSKQLGEKIKKGIARKKERGLYKVNTAKKLDWKEIVALRGQGLGWRGIAARINESRPSKQQVSFSTARRCFINYTKNSCVETVSKVNVS